MRVGNAAANQLQLDIYGEMLDSFFHALHGMERHTEDDFRVLVLLLEHLEDIWQRPDEGIWETRGGREQFTYSKMMAWVAFDRAILIAEEAALQSADRKVGEAARRDSRRNLPQGLQQGEEQLSCRPTAASSWTHRCC